MASLCDPATFLADYDRAAAAHDRRGGERLPRWTGALLRRISR